MKKNEINLATPDGNIIVLALYCRILLSEIETNHWEIVGIAEAFGESPSSVRSRVKQFHNVNIRERGMERGMERGGEDAKPSRIDKMTLRLWHEAEDNWDKFAWDAHELELYMGITNVLGEDELSGLGKDELLERDEEVGAIYEQRTRQDGTPYKMRLDTGYKKRVSRYFFRKSILSSYDARCCITDIDIPEVLIASHIKPWAKSDDDEKMSPHNGLCLNALHDRAFDRGLIAITDKLCVEVCNEIKISCNHGVWKWLVSFDEHPISPPKKISPDPDFQDFLAWHRTHIFRG